MTIPMIKYCRGNVEIKTCSFLSGRPIKSSQNPSSNKCSDRGDRSVSNPHSQTKHSTNLQSYTSNTLFILAVITWKGINCGNGGVGGVDDLFRCILIDSGHFPALSISHTKFWSAKIRTQSSLI